MFGVRLSAWTHRRYRLSVRRAVGQDRGGEVSVGCAQGHRLVRSKYAVQRRIVHERPENALELHYGVQPNRNRTNLAAVCDRLPQDFRSPLESIYARQSKWLYDCFRDPKTACKVEVNYWGNYAEAMAEAGVRLNEAKYLDEAQRTIDGRLKKLVTPDGMLMGEVIPLDVRTPERGLVAVDLGYNLEETLPAMLAAAEVLKDATFETQVVESAKAHLEFMLPDGAIDDTAGSRAYKWTYSGSRTADGVLPLLARLEKRGVKWARRAAERVIALHDRLTGDDGLLYGGFIIVTRKSLPACIIPLHMRKALLNTSC